MSDTLVCQLDGNCDAVTVCQLDGSCDAVDGDVSDHNTKLPHDTTDHNTKLLKDIITLALASKAQNTIAAKQFLEYLTAKHSFDYQRSVLLKTTTLLPSAKDWLQQIYG